MVFALKLLEHITATISSSATVVVIFPVPKVEVVAPPEFVFVWSMTLDAARPVHSLTSLDK